MLKSRICIMVADAPVAQAKVGDISRCPVEPPQYFEEQFSKLNNLDNQHKGKTIYFPRKGKRIW